MVIGSLLLGLVFILSFKALAKEEVENIFVKNFFSKTVDDLKKVQKNPEYISQTVIASKAKQSKEIATSDRGRIRDDKKNIIVAVPINGVAAIVNEKPFYKNLSSVIASSIKEQVRYGVNSAKQSYINLKNNSSVAVSKISLPEIKISEVRLPKLEIAANIQHVGRSVKEETASVFDSVKNFFSNIFKKESPDVSPIVAQPAPTPSSPPQPSLSSSPSQLAPAPTQAVVQPTVINQVSQKELQIIKEKVIVDNSALLLLAKQIETMNAENEKYKEGQQKLISELSQISNVGPRGSVAYTIGNPTFTGTAQGLEDDDIPDDITVSTSKNLSAGNITASGNITSGGNITAGGVVIDQSGQITGTTGATFSDKIKIGPGTIIIDGINNYIASPSNALSIYTTSTPLAISAITATGTWSSYFTGNFGIGTTTPGSGLSVQATSTLLGGPTYIYGQLTLPNFFATSTTATSTFGGGVILAQSAGNVGIGTSTPASHALSVAGNVLIGGTATNTFANGIQLQSGCFRLSNGSCAGDFSLANVTESGSNTGISSTSPGSALEVGGFTVIKGNLNVEATSTVSSLIATSTLSVGTSTPGTNTQLTAQGNVYISGGLGIGAATTSANDLFVKGIVNIGQSGNAISPSAANTLAFLTGGEERARITSTGDLLVGSGALPYGTGGQLRAIVDSFGSATWAQIGGQKNGTTFSGFTLSGDPVDLSATLSTDLLLSISSNVWSLTGGFDLARLSVNSGSGAADTIFFGTAGIDRVTITETLETHTLDTVFNGKVGIASATPGTNLDVDGPSIFSATSTISAVVATNTLAIATTSIGVNAQLAVAGNSYISGGLGIGAATTSAGGLFVKGSADIYDGLIVRGGKTAIATTTANEVFSISGSNVRPIIGDSSTHTNIYSTYNSQTWNALEIFTNGGTAAGLNFTNKTTNTDSAIGGVNWVNKSGGTEGVDDLRLAVISTRTSGASNSGALLFYTSNAGALAEQARITNAGDILHGVTSLTEIYSGFGAQGNRILEIGRSTATASDAPFVGLNLTKNLTGTTNFIGSIQFANTAITASDKRLAIINTYTDGAINNGLMNFYTTFDGTVNKRATILSTGEFGIGRSYPSTTLEVVGTTTTNGLAILNSQFYIGNGKTATSSIYGQYGNLGFASTVPYGQVSIEAQQGIVGSTTPIFVVADQGTGTPSIYVSGNNGSVGVGTANPGFVNGGDYTGTVKLQVSSAGATQSVIDGGTSAQLFFNDQDSTANTRLFRILANADVLAIEPLDDAGGQSPANAFVVHNSGNVGLGLTTPTTINSVTGFAGPLHIASSGTAGLTVDGATAATILLNDQNSTANTRIFQFNVDTNILRLRPLADDGSGSPGDAFIMDQAGNIGLGKTGPTTVLDVVGTTTSSGISILGRQLYIGNGLVATSSIFGEYGKLGFATASPYGQFSIEADEDVVGSSTPIFVIGDQGTATPFIYVSGNNGFVGVATDSPATTLAVDGNVLVSGTTTVQEIKFLESDIASSTPNRNTLYADNIVKAWINFESKTATPVVAASFNVSSLTDNGVGDITINFQQGFSNDGSASIGNCRDKNAVNGVVGVADAEGDADNSNVSRNSIRLFCISLAAATFDPDWWTVASFGNQ